MPLRLIGAGFGRTGTLSLKIALEKIGYGRCYHMMEVFVNPHHIEKWLNAASGDTIDWDEMFMNYASCVDWPACYFWDQLTAHFPEAKVLLSVRDPDGWYESVINTIYISMMRPTTKDPLQRKQLDMARKIVLEQHFNGRFEDKNYAIDIYNRHIEMIRETVPENRLLVFDVSEGWRPLCEFLKVPVPDGPFPCVNTTEQFKSSCFAQNRTPEEKNHRAFSKNNCELKN